MTLITRSVGVIAVVLIFLAAAGLSGQAPAAADDNATTLTPCVKTWGNSSGRTSCNAAGWGRSDTTMGCSGINNNSKCYFVPCKYCCH